MTAQELMNRWCDLEEQVIELFRDANSALRKEEQSNKDNCKVFLTVRSACFKVIKCINNQLR